VVAILDIIIDIHKGNFVKGFSYHMIIYVLFEFNSVSRIQEEDLYALSYWVQ